MNEKPARKDSIEVSSGELKAELIEIKERVGALETIASISNRKEVEEYVRAHLKTETGRHIMDECEDARTRKSLMSKFNFASPQALDNHLNPLRRADLIQQRFDEAGVQSFEWSKLFRGLPQTARDQILGRTKPKRGHQKA
jgi:hypothetical protein